ncbi:MAG: formimidoylglutamate deiminase [Pseudomonadota bacterium]
MKTILADQALVDGQWATCVRVDIGDDGHIAAVVHEAACDRQTEDEGSSVHRVGCLVPAPANAHSHAFQRAMAGLTEARGPDPRDSFWTWRDRMYHFLRRLNPDQVQDITAFAQMEMLESGFAAVGEFHYLHHAPDGSPYASVAEMAERVLAAAADTGIGLTLLPVFYHQGGCDGRALTGGQRRFGNALEPFLALRAASATALAHAPADSLLGVAPHSLRAVSTEALTALLTECTSGPVHIHIAEQTAEVDEVLAHHGARPVQWLFDTQDVDARWCLVHATHLDNAELQQLASSDAVAGLCPVTESSLGDGIFRAVEHRNAGGRIAVGSDSNIRVSLAEELRTLEYSQRLRDRGRAALATPTASTGRALFDAALRGGARACARPAGITAGCWADLLALDLGAPDAVGRSGDALLDSFVFARGEALVGDVWSAGRHVVSGGRHRDRDCITARYRAALGAILAAP